MPAAREQPLGESSSSSSSSGGESQEMEESDASVDLRETGGENAPISADIADKCEMNNGEGEGETEDGDVFVKQPCEWQENGQQRFSCMTNTTDDSEDVTLGCPLIGFEGHDLGTCDLCLDSYSLALPLSRMDVDHVDESQESDGGISADITSVQAKIERTEQKRLFVAQEMRETEENFIQMLYDIHKSLLMIRGANLVFKVIKECDVRVALPDVTSLIELHTTYIRPALDTLLAKWSVDSRLSSVFLDQEPQSQGKLRLIPALQMYKSGGYASLMATAGKKVHELRKGTPGLDSLITEIERDHIHSKISLHETMMTLHQRLCRYRLLLDAYVKYVSDEEERILTHEAMAQFNLLIESVENDIYDKEKFGELYQIQGELEGSASIMSHGRHLIKRGDVIYLSKTGRIRRKRHLIVFNGLMLLSYEKNLLQKYKVKDTIDVQGLRLLEAVHLESCGIDLRTSLLIKSTQKAFTLLFRTQEERGEWQDAILRAIGGDRKKHFRNNRTLSLATDVCNTQWKASDFSHAPTMLPDNHAQSCMICDTRFTPFFNRRHHCRGCGMVIDRKCSTWRLRLPYANHSAMMVCDMCYDHAMVNYPDLPVMTKKSIKLSSKSSVDRV